MRLSSIEVVFHGGCLPLRPSSLEVVLAQISSFGTFPGGGVGGGGWGWVESRIRLISAEAEAEAYLGLAELGNRVTLFREGVKIETFICRQLVCHFNFIV